jgi:hypothetical protein
MKAMIPVLFILTVASYSLWQISLTAQYPTYATGVFYTDSTLAEDGTKIQFPFDFLEENKLVFIDLELSDSQLELEYNGRIIPLEAYRAGDYLPLIVYYSPQGEVKVGIRTCEPCSGFSMHLEERKYLVCDICNTKWDLETLEGISGGCPDYPPPQLPFKAEETIEIDISKLEVNVIKT